MINLSSIYYLRQNRQHEEARWQLVELAALLPDDCLVQIETRVDNLICDSEKSYHVISQTIDTVNIKITSCCSRTNQDSEIEIIEKSEQSLVHFTYRHKVLNILYKIKSFSNKDFFFNGNQNTNIFFGNFHNS